MAQPTDGAKHLDKALLRIYARDSNHMSGYVWLCLAMSGN